MTNDDKLFWLNFSAENRPNEVWILGNFITNDDGGGQKSDFYDDVINVSPLLKKVHFLVFSSVWF